MIQLWRTELWISGALVTLFLFALFFLGRETGILSVGCWAGVLSRGRLQGVVGSGRLTKLWGGPLGSHPCCPATVLVRRTLGFALLDFEENASRWTLHSL